MGKNLTVGGYHFSDSYRNDLFLNWYKSGQPGTTEFWLKLPVDTQGNRPEKITLTKWIQEWKKKAEELDREVEQGLVESTVQAKVEMLGRHIETAQEIQTLSLDYLREHKEELTPNSAVRLLQLGIEIERDSVGIPEALDKMRKLDDEALLNEINAILKDSDITIEALEEPVEDANND